MPVEQLCPNCKRQKIVYIDKKNDKVSCSECEAELPATHYLKVQLKTLQQYKPKVQVPFQVKCENCKKEGTPKLKNDNLLCFNCLKPLAHITEHFKLAIKNFLKQ